MNVATTPAAEGCPRRAFSVEDVSRMLEAGVIRHDEKFELVEGDIVMAAAKSVAHERIKSALTIAVVRALPEAPERRRLVTGRHTGAERCPALPGLQIRLGEIS